MSVETAEEKTCPLDCICRKWNLPHDISVNTWAFVQCLDESDTY
jgi:hypothetical protein